MYISVSKFMYRKKNQVFVNSSVHMTESTHKDSENDVLNK